MKWMSGPLALTGPLAEASLAALRFDTAVIGCCGLSAAYGMTAYHLVDVAEADADHCRASRRKRWEIVEPLITDVRRHVAET